MLSLLVTGTFEWAILLLHLVMEIVVYRFGARVRKPSMCHALDFWT
jgi:hypothetical protein